MNSLPCGMLSLAVVAGGQVVLDEGRTSGATYSMTIGDLTEDAALGVLADRAAEEGGYTSYDDFRRELGLG